MNWPADAASVARKSPYRPLVRWAALLLLSGICLPAAAAQKHALLIGINDYRANDSDQPAPAENVWIPEDLGGAVNDVRLLRRLLTSRFGFPAESIVELTDQAATRDAIIAALESLTERVGPEDTVYIHFSGHGSQVEDAGGDESDGRDETLLAHDARTGGVADITDDELGSYLAQFETPNVLVILDACHSGTATRSGGALKARVTPADARSDLYSGAAAIPSDNPGNGHILMTGAADNQSALDGPIADGEHFGLFSLSFARALERLPSGASTRDIHDEVRKEMRRIGDQFGLYVVPRSQLEGDEPRLDAPLLTGGDAERAWLPATLESGNRVRLDGATELGAQEGSLWAVYPPGEREFKPGGAEAIVRIDKATAEEPVAVLEGRGQLDVDSLLPDSRAVLLAPPPAETRAPVRLGRMSDEQRRAWTERLRSAGLPLELVEPGARTRYFLDEVNGELVLRDATGLNVLGRHPSADLIGALRMIERELRRGLRLGALLALADPGSGLNVDVRLNPVDAKGQVRGVALVAAETLGAFEFRQAGAPRRANNSLQLEIEASHDSFLTVVNVDPHGNVAQLFPNPISERNVFLPNGAVRGGETTMIPDSLGPNRAGFHWDLVPPAGLDTLVVFAASDLELARTLRRYLTRFSNGGVQRSGEATTRLDLYERRPAAVQRGAATPGSESSASGWASASVSVMIKEPGS